MPRDPFRNFKFRVEVEGFVDQGFTSIEGLSEETEVIDYREGGDNETPRRLSGQTTFGEITMMRGLGPNNDFANWRQQIYDARNTNGQQGEVEGWRKQVVIYLMDKAGNDVKQWTVLRAWPSAREVEELDANGNDVLMESITLQNEGVIYEDLTGA